MANIMKLEEMLEQIKPVRLDRILMSTRSAYERVRKRSNDQFSCYFLPEEYADAFEWRKKHFIDTAIYECIFNAVRAGNRYKSGCIALRLHKGERGIVVEVEDNGEGIPEEIIRKLQQEQDCSSFLYGNGNRGRGFHQLRQWLDEGVLDGIGFNEKRNAVYLMALF